ncbi:CCR4-NOT transcription complex subunit 9-like [Paramacrobiotus metropolitanus]|uniref:CCR4-NOT transcription complex subunit 9-like n=1 Tax=Paramacrobiotus metropolitanus TaxID=2943436 RepID=UPI002445E6FC|nr:CCR4-NOT transcription complex subunit 9-like [Paramacrobiotus metropolitanus]
MIYRSWDSDSDMASRLANLQGTGPGGGAVLSGAVAAAASQSIPNALPSSTSSPVQPVSPEQIQQWIVDVCDPRTRERALLELSKRREQFPDLALWIWHSFGAVAALLQEVTETYILMEPNTLSAHQSNRVCNALALVQCLASHNETRKPFLEARIPMFLYPFLSSSHNTRPFEYLRLTSLGVIGALVKTDDPEVVPYLLQAENSEIIPLCLKIMESGTDLSKTVAVFIVQKILSDEKGLAYMCATYDRFTHVANVLGKMIENLPLDGRNSNRLFKHVLRCYVRFSEHQRAREALRNVFPAKFQDNTFLSQLKEDRSLGQWMLTLCRNIGMSSAAVSALFPNGDATTVISPTTQNNVLPGSTFFRDIPTRQVDNQSR